MKVNLTHSFTKQVKQTKLDFSWTVLFFGCWPMLFRADWKWFFITFAANFILAILFFPVMFVFNIVMSINYNKLYVKELLAQGFVPADNASRNAILTKGIVLTSPTNTTVVSEELIED